jgi:hypothetical protein
MRRIVGLLLAAAVVVFSGVAGAFVTGGAFFLYAGIVGLGSLWDGGAFVGTGAGVGFLAGLAVGIVWAAAILRSR